MFNRSHLAPKVALLAGTVLAPLSAFATGVDVTPITDTKTDVLAVGVAVFGVMIAIKLYKWIRRAL